MESFKNMSKKKKENLGTGAQRIVIEMSKVCKEGQSVRL